MKTNNGFVLGMVLGLAGAQLASAQPTTMDLVKKGDDYVGMQSRDKIIEMYSDKSVAGLEPNVWHIVYYDPSVFFKTTDVKFGAGQEMEVSHPMHPFEMPARPDQIMDSSKLNVDAREAVDTASSQPLLKGLTLRASELTLQKENGIPTWKVELWAARASDPSREVSVGYVCISAVDRSVLTVDLHPGRAN